MLVMTLKKNSLLKVNEGKQLIGIQGVSKKGLLVKVLNRNEDGTYTNDDVYVSTKDNPFNLSGKLKVIHLKGSGKQIKVGFEGQMSVVRCPKKFKYTIQRPRNLDDDFFDFDTEGYWWRLMKGEKHYEIK